MNFNQYFSLTLVIAILIAPDPSTSIDPIGGAIVGKKLVLKKVILKKALLAPILAPKLILPLAHLKSKFLPAVHFGTKLPIVLKVLAVKKALILAPLAIGAKAAALATGAVVLAVPAAIGAIIGAPLGAIIGAKAGALAGGLKGVVIGKALIGTKLALVAALAAKPVVIAVGLKAKAVHFLGKGIGLAGKGVLVAGTKMAHFGKKMTAASLAVKGIGTQVVDQIKSSLATLPQFQIPQIELPSALPALPSLDSLPLASLAAIQSTGPKSLEATIKLNTPFTGEKFTKVGISSNLRRRRSPDPQPQLPPGGVLSLPVGRPVVPPSQLDALVNFVQSQRLQGCLARVICELSANPNVHGPEGIRFGSSLLTMSRTQNPAAVQFRAASQVGTQARNPAACARRFANCSMSSADIVTMGNNMLAPTAQ